MEKELQLYVPKDINGNTLIISVYLESRTYRKEYNFRFVDKTSNAKLATKTEANKLEAQLVWLGFKKI